jgi:Uma2 family endonuclease
MAVQLRDTPRTYEDLTALPDDGRRYEITEGVLYEMPGPNGEHSTAVMNLITLPLPFLTSIGAYMRTAPTDVFMSGTNLVQPDVLVVLPDGPAWVSTRGVEGPPDLIVEVLPPSNGGHDTLTKRALYGRAGVREYWIVDPEARTVEVLAPVGDALHSRGVVSGEALVTSPLLPAVSFPASAVFAGFDAIRPAPGQE